MQSFLPFMSVHIFHGIPFLSVHCILYVVVISSLTSHIIIICTSDSFCSFAHTGSRSEALASAQLELHGLQDMLDNLLSWITDADGKMTETEAMPIGTTIEAVEQQLANHEVSAGNSLVKSCGGEAIIVDLTFDSIALNRVFACIHLLPCQEQPFCCIISIDHNTNCVQKWPPLA